MIQKRTGGITGLNNGEKKDLLTWTTTFETVIIIIIMSQFTSPLSHRHHVTLQRPCFSNVNCFCFNSAFAPRISILPHTIITIKVAIAIQRWAAFCFVWPSFHWKFFLTFITKATMSPSSSWNDQFPNKLKGHFFCNLISKCNRCIYRYFSFINHPQSVSVWLNCFA